MTTTREPGQAIASGLLAAAALLGVAELVASVAAPPAGPISIIGSVIIDHTPDNVREWAIHTFGTNDKLFLIASILLVAAVVAAVAGMLERRDRPIGSAIFVLMSAVVGALALTRAGASVAYLLPVGVGVVAAVVSLRLLVKASDTSKTPDQSVHGRTRRGFLATAGLVAAIAALCGGLGRVVATKFRDLSGEQASLDLPTPADRAPTLPSEAELRTPGLSSFVTSNEDFYRIDISLGSPRISYADWKLRIYGLVENELTIDWAELVSRPLVSRYITLACVSNSIGGPLIGNALWQGLPVRDLIKRAGPLPGADMVLSRGVDGFSAGTPLEVLTDPRDSLLAIGMNNQPLPVEHGYPARLVVPGLYGYVSATKWVTELKVTRFDADEGYWTPRGWATHAPIKTHSRVDTPRNGESVTAGSVTLAGVAWAQHRGVTKVEVQLDNGGWVAAELSAEYSNDTWRQWKLTVDVPRGPHLVRVRATDRTGAMQIGKRHDAVPDGATGWHEVAFRAD